MAKPPAPKRQRADGGAAPRTGHVDEYIGKRVERYWTEEDAGSPGWYPGIVSDYDAARAEHCIVYEMGTADESYEWFNIRKGSPSEVRMLPGAPIDVTANLPPTAKGGAGRGGAPVKAGGGDLDEVEELARQEAELKKRLAMLEADDSDDDDDAGADAGADAEMEQLAAEEEELKRKLAALEEDDDDDE